MIAAPNMQRVGVPLPGGRKLDWWEVLQDALNQVLPAR
jgi:hypothetical protein